MVCGSLQSLSNLWRPEPDVNCVDYRATTPLLAACAGGIEELIVFLLDAGANAKVKEEGGLGPLAMADFHKKKLSKKVAERLQVKRFCNGRIEA